MDLESPLRTIASPLEAETLRVLAAADSEFTAAQVHRLIEHASQFGVRKALARLADTGLVHRTEYGAMTLWGGNREHVLWPAIALAVDARRTLLDRIRSKFDEKNDVGVYLYGSFARGTAGPTSDIDILIVYPDSATHEDIVDFAHGLSDQVSAWSGNKAHIYNATRESVRESYLRADPIMASISEDAVALVGPPFDQLIRVLTAEASSRA